MVGTARALDVAAGVPDPELPMVTVADLGILREVREDGDAVTVVITPTYSGCPAMREIGHDLRRRLEQAGDRHVTVRTELSPPWTTDWITPEGRRKLAAAGIAPPDSGGPAAWPGRPRAAHPDPGAPRRALPAVRVGANPRDVPIQRDRLQGALPLRAVPRAVRARQGDSSAVITDVCPVWS